MSVGKYAGLVFGAAGAALGLGWPLGLGPLDRSARTAVLLGAAIAVLNAIAAFGLLRWSERRSNVVFMRALLGGTAGRMALMLAALVFGVKALSLPQLPLVASLLSFFALFLVVELSIVHRRAEAKVTR